MTRRSRSKRRYDIENAREAFEVDPNRGKRLYEAIIKHYMTINALQTEQLERDPLTNLLNRRALTERLERIHSEAIVKEQPYSMVFADIDDFGKFNKDYGHVVGDIVLTESAERISGLIRKNDLVFRYGGEEILVVAPKTNEDGASTLVRKIVTGFNTGDVSQYLRGILGPDRRLTLSAGVATWDVGMEPFDVVTMANSGMLRAKSQPGKGAFYMVKKGELVK